MRFARVSNASGPDRAAVAGRLLALFALTLSACSCERASDPVETSREEPAERIEQSDVTLYDVQLSLNAEGDVQGDATLRVEPTHTLQLDVGSLDDVRFTIDARPIEHIEGRIEVATEDAPITEVRVSWRATPSSGLRAQGQEIFTAFHTYAWMPVSFAPSDRAAFHLRLLLPRHYEVAAPGRRLASRPDGDGREHRFELQRESPAYTFGFAAGALEEHVAERGAVEHRVLHPGFTNDELTRLVTKAELAIAFFADKAGMPYPGASFTQAWLNEALPQELVDMAVMPASEARTMLANPNEDWMLVHEISHQWWGNRITCATWSEFWLNEGFATFMVAAFKEHEQGRPAYDHEIALAERRLERLRAAGRDRALSMPLNSRHDEVGGGLPYSKGLLLLHALRQRVGDVDFWSAIQAYSREGWQHGVTSIDLQRAMEDASGEDLSSVFAEFGARHRSRSRPRRGR